MSNENNVIIVNKQALMRTARELEKQSTLHSLMLTICLEQIEDIRRKLDIILAQEESNQARETFLELFMSKTEWSRLFSNESDERFEQWKTEAQAAYPKL